MQLRSFAFGELGWSYDRYRDATIEEWNCAVKYFWEHREWEMWNTREIVWNIIQWAPFFKDEGKPKRRSDIYKLSSDKEEIVKKVKAQKVTEQDLRVMEALNFKANGPVK